MNLTDLPNTNRYIENKKDLEEFKRFQKNKKNQKSNISFKYQNEHEQNLKDRENEDVLDDLKLQEIMYGMKRSLNDADITENRPLNKKQRKEIMENFQPTFTVSKKDKLRNDDSEKYNMSTKKQKKQMTTKMKNAASMVTADVIMKENEDAVAKIEEEYLAKQELLKAISDSISQAKNDQTQSDLKVRELEIKQDMQQLKDRASDLRNQQLTSTSFKSPEAPQKINELSIIKDFDNEFGHKNAKKLLKHKDEKDEYDFQELTQGDFKQVEAKKGNLKELDEQQKIFEKAYRDLLNKNVNARNETQKAEINQRINHVNSELRTIQQEKQLAAKNQIANSSQLNQTGSSQTNNTFKSNESKITNKLITELEKKDKYDMTRKQDKKLLETTRREAIKFLEDGATIPIGRMSNKEVDEWKEYSDKALTKMYNKLKTTSNPKKYKELHSKYEQQKQYNQQLKIKSEINSRIKTNNENKQKESELKQIEENKPGISSAQSFEDPSLIKKKLQQKEGPIEIDEKTVYSSDPDLNEKIHKQNDKIAKLYQINKRLILMNSAMRDRIREGSQDESKQTRRLQEEVKRYRKEIEEAVNDRDAMFSEAKALEDMDREIKLQKLQTFREQTNPNNIKPPPPPPKKDQVQESKLEEKKNEEPIIPQEQVQQKKDEILKLQEENLQATIIIQELKAVAESQPNSSISNSNTSVSNSKQSTVSEQKVEEKIPEKIKVHIDNLIAKHKPEANISKITNDLARMERPKYSSIASLDHDFERIIPDRKIRKEIEKLNDIIMENSVKIKQNKDEIQKSDNIINNEEIKIEEVQKIPTGIPPPSESKLEKLQLVSNDPSEAKVKFKIDSEDIPKNSKKSKLEKFYEKKIMEKTKLINRKISKLRPLNEQKYFNAIRAHGKNNITGLSNFEIINKQSDLSPSQGVNQVMETDPSPVVISSFDDIISTQQEEDEKMEVEPIIQTRAKTPEVIYKIEPKNEQHNQVMIIDSFPINNPSNIVNINVDKMEEDINNDILQPKMNTIPSQTISNVLQNNNNNDKMEEDDDFDILTEMLQSTIKNPPSKKDQIQENKIEEKIEIDNSLFNESEKKKIEEKMEVENFIKSPSAPALKIQPLVENQDLVGPNNFKSNIPDQPVSYEQQLNIPKETDNIFHSFTKSSKSVTTNIPTNLSSRKTTVPISTNTNVVNLNNNSTISNLVNSTPPKELVTNHIIPPTAPPDQEMKDVIAPRIENEPSSDIPNVFQITTLPSSINRPMDYVYAIQAQNNPSERAHLSTIDSFDAERTFQEVPRNFSSRSTGKVAHNTIINQWVAKQATKRKLESISESNKKTSIPDDTAPKTQVTVINTNVKDVTMVDKIETTLSNPKENKINQQANANTQTPSQLLSSGNKGNNQTTEYGPKRGTNVKSTLLQDPYEKNDANVNINNPSSNQDINPTNSNLNIIDTNNLQIVSANTGSQLITGATDNNMYQSSEQKLDQNQVSTFLDTQHQVKNNSEIEKLQKDFSGNIMRNYVIFGNNVPASSKEEFYKHYNPSTLQSDLYNKTNHLGIPNFFTLNPNQRANAIMTHINKLVNGQYNADQLKQFEQNKRTQIDLSIVPPEAKHTQYLVNFYKNAIPTEVVKHMSDEVKRILRENRGNPQVLPQIQTFKTDYDNLAGELTRMTQDLHNQATYGQGDLGEFQKKVEEKTLSMWEKFSEFAQKWRSNPLLSQMLDESIQKFKTASTHSFKLTDKFKDNVATYKHTLNQNSQGKHINQTHKNLNNITNELLKTNKIDTHTYLDSHNNLDTTQYGKEYDNVNYNYNNTTKPSQKELDTIYFQNKVKEWLDNNVDYEDTKIIDDEEDDDDVEQSIIQLNRQQNKIYDNDNDIEDNLDQLDQKLDYLPDNIISAYNEEIEQAEQGGNTEQVQLVKDDSVFLVDLPNLMNSSPPSDQKISKSKNKAPKLKSFPDSKKYKKIKPSDVTNPAVHPSSQPVIVEPVGNNNIIQSNTNHEVNIANVGPQSVLKPKNRNKDTNFNRKKAPYDYDSQQIIIPDSIILPPKTIKNTSILKNNKINTKKKKNVSFDSSLDVPIINQNEPVIQRKKPGQDLFSRSKAPYEYDSHNVSIPKTINTNISKLKSSGNKNKTKNTLKEQIKKAASNDVKILVPSTSEPVLKPRKRNKDTNFNKSKAPYEYDSHKVLIPENTILPKSKSKVKNKSAILNKNKNKEILTLPRKPRKNKEDPYDRNKKPYDYDGPDIFKDLSEKIKEQPKKQKPNKVIRIKPKNSAALKKKINPSPIDQLKVIQPTKSLENITVAPINRKKLKPKSIVQNLKPRKKSNITDIPVLTNVIDKQLKKSKNNTIPTRPSYKPKKKNQDQDQDQDQITELDLPKNLLAKIAANNKHKQVEEILNKIPIRQLKPKAQKRKEALSRYLADHKPKAKILSTEDLEQDEQEPEKIITEASNRNNAMYDWKIKNLKDRGRVIEFSNGIYEYYISDHDDIEKLIDDLAKIKGSKLYILHPVTGHIFPAQISDIAIGSTYLIYSKDAKKFKGGHLAPKVVHRHTLDMQEEEMPFYFLHNGLEKIKQSSHLTKPKQENFHNISRRHHLYGVMGGSLFKLGKKLLANLDPHQLAASAQHLLNQRIIKNLPSSTSNYVKNMANNYKASGKVILNNVRSLNRDGKAFIKQPGFKSGLRLAGDISQGITNIPQEYFNSSVRNMNTTDQYLSSVPGVNKLYAAAQVAIPEIGIAKQGAKIYGNVLDHNYLAAAQEGAKAILGNVVPEYITPKAKEIASSALVKVASMPSIPGG